MLAMFGDSINTDNISPAGNIATDSPAGKFLQERGVQPRDFNSYGSRRGNDLVMARGTFAQHPPEEPAGRAEGRLLDQALPGRRRR